MSKTGSTSGALAALVALTVACTALTAAGTLGAYSSSGDAAASANAWSIDPGNETIEDEYVERTPERGDEYFEAAASDGSWISYINPRDDYRTPYLGGGSGKICATLLNEAGEVVVGESVPGTTVTIPTGESIAWHENADPMVVEYPLTDNYERPLDSDQFGTSPDVPQGDGYMDAHCIEVHGLPDDGTVEYGQAQVGGEYADWIDVVGYVQQENTPGWDSSVDPIADAESYEEAGGGWTYRTDASHGQVVVVLQLDPPADAYSSDGPAGDDGDDSDEGDESDSGDDEDDGGDADDPSDDQSNQTDTSDDPRPGETDPDGDDASDSSDDSGDGTDAGPGDDENDDRAADSGDDGSPGFGVVAALAAIALVGLGRLRR